MGWVVLLAGIVAFFVVLVRASDPKRLIAKAQAAAAVDKSKALALYQKAINILERPGASAGPPRLALLQQAYIGLGACRLALNQRPAAFEAYKKAKETNATLETSAEAFVAEYYAETDDRSAGAFESYLKYMGLKQPSIDARATKVYSVLQSMCEVPETLKASDRKVVAERLRKVLALSPTLEWAHYYLGLATLLDGHAEEAATSFGNAYSLSKDNALTSYWLGVCFLQQAEPNLNAAILWMDRFLAAPVNGSKIVKRQASAAFEIGRRLLEGAGKGAPRVDQALLYLREAVNRAPDNGEYHYQLAIAYALSGDRDRALASFGEAVQKSPENKSYAFRFGVENKNAGRLSQAADALRLAVKIDDGFVEAHELLASICFDLEDWPSAEKHARRFLQLRANDPRYLAILVLALYCQNKFAEIAAALEKSPAPGRLDRKLHAAAIFAAGRAYLKVKAFQAAIDWLSTLAGDARVDYYRACALGHAGQDAEAMALFSTIAEAGGDLAIRALVQRAHLLHGQGKAEEAERDYRLALEREAGNVQAIQGPLAIACEGERIEESSLLLERLLAIDPGNACAVYARGLTHERLGKIDEAIADFKSLADDGNLGGLSALRIGVLECRRGDFEAAYRWLEGIQGNSDPLLFYRGWALVSLGRAAEALEVWTQLQTRHPEDRELALKLHQTQYLLGSQHAEAGRLDAAVELWSTYVQGCPEDDKTKRDLAQLHFRLAWRLLEEPAMRDVERALAQLQRAIEYDAENSVYAFHAALCELDLKQFAICEDRLRRLVSLERTPRAVYHLALCLLRKGDSGEAEQLLKELRNQPADEEYVARAAWAGANLQIGRARYDEAAQIMAAVF